MNKDKKDTKTETPLNKSNVEGLVMKPCGCGSEKLKISVNDGNYATYNVWVRCLECGDVGPSKRTIEDCIRGWNEQAS